MNKDIIDAFHIYNKDEVISCKHLESSQNNIFIIKTSKDSYIIKEYSHDAIRNNKDLEIRKEQIRISRIWKAKNIPCILPLSDIFYSNNHYYIIYPYIEGKVYDEGKLNLEQIKKLAYYQAKIHKLNISSTLPHHIKKIDFKDSKIQSMIDLNNKYVHVANKEKVVCHNDYKPLNIIWVDDKPNFIDFDAVYCNHPTFSLLESAYTFTHKGTEINLAYYKEYIKAYISEYKKELKDINAAIYGCWNGKIQWLKYLKETKKKDKGIDNLTNQMIRYQDYVNDIKNILL